MAENTQYQKVKEITDQLEQGIQELFESERYMTWLRTMSKFHDYSLNNTLLIAFQKPDATLVAGYTAWQKQFGRQVQKGEKAIKILAPAPYKEKVEMEKIDPVTRTPILDADGKPVTEVQEVTRPAFKVVSVFDVSQTEGREIPSLGVDELSGDVREYELFFEALKRSCPVSMEFEEIEGSVKGYYHQMEQRIAIREGMSQVQTIKTAIHEMAHQRLHAIDPLDEAAEIVNQTRSSKEVEAESIAYTVCQHYGIDTSDYSFAYVAGWSHGKETPELKASLNTIRKTANEMIKEIDGHIAEINKEIEQEQENRITCYLKISGSMGSEYEIDRIAGTAETIEAVLKEALENDVDNIPEFLESKGIPVLVVASSIDDDPGRYIVPDYEYDVDTKQVYRHGTAIGREMTREEQARALVVKVDSFLREMDNYQYNHTVSDRYVFMADLQKNLLAGNEKVDEVMGWFQQEMDAETDYSDEAIDLVVEMKNFVKEGKELEEEATITFYVAECSEFPNMGEFHEGLSLEEAFRLYDQIPAERMNGIKGIGFELHDGSDYDGQYPLMEAGRMDEELINMVQHYKESPLVQQAIINCKRILGEREQPEHVEEVTDGNYQISKEHYLEIHLSDDGSWDYTLYNREFLDADGGQIGVELDANDNLVEVRKMNIDQAVQEVLKSYGMEQEEIVPMDKEEFENKRDFAFAKDMYEKGFVYEDYVLSNRIAYELRQDGIELMDFSSEQSSVIYEAAEKGLDVITFAKTDFSVEQMKLMAELLENGKDVTSVVCNGKKMDLSETVLSQKQIADIYYFQKIEGIVKEDYSEEQWKTIQRGIRERLDVTQVANPNLAVIEMKDILKELRKEKREAQAAELEATLGLQDSPKQTEKKKSVLADLQKKQAQVAGTKAPKNEHTKKKVKEIE